MHSIKISSIKTMTASPESQIQIDCILDLEHLVSGLDDTSFNLVFALIQKRISDEAVTEAKKQRALDNLKYLKAQLK
jgi:hypothetical protein